MSDRSLGTTLALPLSLVVLTAATWWWQTSIVRTRPADAQHERWDRLKEEYPIPAPGVEMPQLSEETVETVVRANPFSPKRHLPPPTTPGGGSGTALEPIEPAKPQFVYKGRINLGTRQRAIVEDTSGHKTYFLEVGQAVAGFKVLDIAENRVVLSDPQTKEEVVVSLATPTSQTTQ